LPNPTPARKGERRRDTSLRSPSPEITRAYLVPQHFLVWRVTLPILSLTPHKQVATRTRTHQEGRYLILPLTPSNGCALGENLNTDQSSRDRCCIFFAVRLGLLVLAGASRGYPSLALLCASKPPTDHHEVAVAKGRKRQRTKRTSRHERRTLRLEGACVGCDGGRAERRR